MHWVSEWEKKTKAASSAQAQASTLPGSDEEEGRKSEGNGFVSCMSFWVRGRCDPRATVLCDLTAMPERRGRWT